MFCAVVLLALAAIAAAAGPLRSDIFPLYVYGASGTGGYPLININDTMHFSSRPRDKLRSDAHLVQFQMQGHSLHAVSNSGSGYVMLLGPSGIVTYSSEDDGSSASTNVDFGLSSGNLYARRGNAKRMRFYAEPTDDPDLYAVGWNLTDNGSPLAIRKTPPQERAGVMR